MTDITTVADGQGQASPVGNSGLKVRLISASIGIPLVLLAIWGGVPGVAVLATIACLVAGYELCEMARAQKLERLAFPGFAVLFLIGSLYLVVDSSVNILIGLAAIVAATMVGVATVLTRPAGQLKITLPLLTAAIYFGATLAHAVPLVDLADGRQWILLAILGTFAVDTGAYFTGRAVGKRLLAPQISPRKTWEGVFGGLAAGIGAVIALVAIFGLPVAVWQAAFVGSAITVAGVAGDLFESWLKRRANVKDSGKIIPGHGGILDRVDSLAPNLAVVYWAARIILN